MAIVVGFYLAKNVLAQDEGSPKMQEIAKAIQEGASAYLRRQFKTIAVILIPLAIIVFLTSTAIIKPDGTVALTLRRRPVCGAPLAFILGCLASGAHRLHRHDAGHARQRPHRRRGADRTACRRRSTVAFRTGGVAGMFTVGLGLLGATAIIMSFQNTSSVILVGFGFGGSLLALFLRVGGGIFTKAADVGADLVGKVEAGIPEDDPRNPATIADNVGDNVGDCAGMAADLFESYEVTLVASIILGVAAFNSIGANPALGLIFPLAARAIGVIASIVGVFAVKAKEGETNALKPINRGFLVAGTLTLVGTLLVALALRRQRLRQRRLEVLRRRGHRPRARAAASAASPSTTPARTTRRCKEIAESAETGPATVVLAGTASGMESSVYAVIAIAIAIGVALALGGGNLQFSLLPRRPHRHGHARHHRRHRLRGHVRPGQRQRRRHRRDERRVPRRARADHGQPRRRRQHHQGRHQGLRHRLGGHRRRRPVRQLHRDRGRRARPREVIDAALKTARACSTCCRSTSPIRRSSSVC